MSEIATKMAGARIDAAVWDGFAAHAKVRGWSVSEALEHVLRASNVKGLPVKRECLVQGAGPRAAVGKQNGAGGKRAAK